MHCFWEYKALADLSESEWESLCDGCGRCCLHKLEDEDTDEILFTRVACRLLDIDSCRCSNYPERRALVPECLDMRRSFTQLHWLPVTCSYRLHAEGKSLPFWHPLLTGNPASVHNAGISVRGFAIPESETDDPEDHVIEWLK
ncbi:YcgN family cysteine cluster protein [Candidatus Methylospira mobilis]|uniref:UPF0260 protein F6R98_01510 n=1 Tax=Candidatus Methylospira mobilis TaxID=1808979 RepID=A0A5Q0BCE0_9GAMM|nr:YcgN family cysteine cluster protein [Candidatus Methylospira mobilis]QFY41460.1 YcgN family cysteine cluster protein [Candidatus Methylospira mobilis]